MNYLKISFISLLFLILQACSLNDNGDEQVIYTSIYPLQFLTEEITGESIQVKTVYPPGVDAHTYEPSSKDIAEISRAKSFIYLGSGMEGFSTTIVDALTKHDVAFIEIGAEKSLFRPTGQNKEQTAGATHSHGNNVDPHFWFDPLRMIQVGEIITEELGKIIPENKTLYEQNMHDLTVKLVALDKLFKDSLQSATKKPIIVSHAAYGYWEERYGISQIPISGLSSSDEPSQKDLVEIAQLAKKEQLKYVITEQTGATRLTTIIQEHINAELRTIHSLETLTETDLENAENYLTLMRKNLDVLIEVTK